MAEADTRETEALSAKVLTEVAGEGMTLSQLSNVLNVGPDKLGAAVRRLDGLGLIETSGEVIRGTPFVRKARNLFNFVA